MTLQIVKLFTALLGMEKNAADIAYSEVIRDNILDAKNMAGGRNAIQIF
jgi:hypothetical protein